MDAETTEKFANLLAGFAVTGAAEELRKEAAAHNLVKESGSPTDNLLWALGAGLAGAGIGGATGYFSTKDEKKKKRNALYGALTGGILGTGVPLAFAGRGIAEDAVEKMVGANRDMDKKVNPPPIEGKLGPALLDVAGIYDSKLNPMSSDALPGHSVYNAYGIPGHLAGAGAGLLISRARNPAPNGSLALREALLKNMLEQRTLTGPKNKKTIEVTKAPWQTAVTDAIDSVGHAAQKSSPGSLRDRIARVLDSVRRIPRAKTGPAAAARDALGVQGGTLSRGNWLLSYLPSSALESLAANNRITQAQLDAINAYHNNARNVQTLTNVGRQNATLDTNAQSRRFQNLRDMFVAVAQRGQRTAPAARAAARGWDVPALKELGARGGVTDGGHGPQGNHYTAPKSGPAPTRTQRIGRFAARRGPAMLAGTGILGHPYLWRMLGNYLSPGGAPAAPPSE